MVVLHKSWIFKIVITLTTFCFSVACLMYSELWRGWGLCRNNVW